jgi:hypothetical protein
VNSRAICAAGKARIWSRTYLPRTEQLQIRGGLERRTYIVSKLVDSFLTPILYLLAEEPVRNDQQQDRCLIVEIHAPAGIDEQLIRLAAEDAIEGQFGKRFTLWSANEDEASQYLQAEAGATHDYLESGAGIPVFWHLLPIV